MITTESIRAGLEAGEFFLEYLPTISLADGRCIGGEALVRWRQGTDIIPPGDFIPLIENHPLSGLVTYWVIDTVANEMTGWLRDNPECHLSINVPPAIIGRGGMEYAARKSGLLDYARQLILEITERGVPDMMGVEAINNSWGMGLRIALDDVTFASGANLAVLARSNFSIIKIDRALVSQIGPDCLSPEWLSGLTALRQSSRLVVIAEGVETELQFHVLRSADIQAAQGFYFSHPIPAADFIAFQR